MTPEPLVLAVVLAAAVMHAAWNALVKQASERLLSFAVVVGAGAVAYLPVALIVDPPARASWPFIAGSCTIHLGYYACLLLGYRYGDLGQVYPIARGTGPLIVALLSAAVVGEQLGTLPALGVACISLGIASLAWQDGTRNADTSRAIAFALLTGVFIACYTLSDGLGVRQSQSRLGYIAWLHVFSGLPFASVVLVRERRKLRAFWRSQGPRAVVGGLVAALAYSLVIWAMSKTELAYVSALREVSVVVAAAIGTLRLGEPFGRRRMIASAVVASGIVLMSLAR
jgi:drug/metabolite transporter (DMT)-like permease